MVALTMDLILLFARNMSVSGRVPKKNSKSTWTSEVTSQFAPPPPPPQKNSLMLATEFYEKHVYLLYSNRCLCQVPAADKIYDKIVSVSSRVTPETWDKLSRTIVSDIRVAQRMVALGQKEHLLRTLEQNNSPFSMICLLEHVDEGSYSFIEDVREISWQYKSSGMFADVLKR